jgi:hypothetical protein
MLQLISNSLFQDFCYLEIYLLWLKTKVNNLVFIKGVSQVKYITEQYCLRQKSQSSKMHYTTIFFSQRGKLLTKKLMLQGYNESRLKSSFRKFYGRYDLVCYYKLSLAYMLNYLSHTTGTYTSLGSLILYMSKGLELFFVTLYFCLLNKNR